MISRKFDFCQTPAKVEIWSGDTDASQTTEDRATQLLYSIQFKLSHATFSGIRKFFATSFEKVMLKNCTLFTGTAWWLIALLNLSLLGFSFVVFHDKG